MNILAKFLKNEKLSDPITLPLTITPDHLTSLTTGNTFYINGQMITSTLSECLQRLNISTEEVIVIEVSNEERAGAAVYCSGSLSGHEAPVLCLDSKNSVLVSGGGDCTIRIWDLITKTQKKIIKKHEHWVQCLAIGNFIASGGMDKKINLYTLEGEFLREIKGHKKSISCLKMWKNIIFSSSRDGTVKAWKSTGECEWSIGHNAPVDGIFIDCTNDHEKSGTVISYSRDGIIKIHGIDGKFIETLNVHSRVNDVVKNNNLIFVGTDSSTAILFDLYQKKLVLKHDKLVSSVAISENRVFLATASFDRTARLYTMKGVMVASIRHLDCVYKVMFNKNIMISASKDKTIKLFDSQKKKKLSELVCGDEVYCLCLAENLLIAGCRDKKVYFFQ
ncbi:Notchless like protein 1 [Dictyocoela muelleri]|nr:Notchless like protein 1 [Dictyocoela muelleri]